MATQPISFVDGRERQESAPEKPLNLLPAHVPSHISVTVRLGDHLAEISAFQDAKSQRTTYSYAVLDLTGERIYQSGGGFLSVAIVVEKAVQHLELLWNAVQF